MLDSLRTLHFTTSQLIYDTSVEAGDFKSPSLPSDYKGQPTYASNDDQVATVDNQGTVTLIKEGVTTIDVDCPADSLYKATQLHYTLRVAAATSTRFYADGIIRYAYDDYMDVQTEFLITDSRLHTVVMGNGIEPAIDTSIDGTFVCPDTVYSNDVPYVVRGINDNALLYCGYLEGCRLPSSVRWVGNGAFRNCFRMLHIDLGTGVDSIASGAFAGCSMLTGLTLPASLRHMEVDALGGNGSLRYVDVRKCQQLHLASARGTDTPFGALNADVLLYLPVGNALTGLNVINTDTLGVMTSQQVTVDSRTYTPAQCANGQLTYELNNLAGEVLFGQLLGHDAYPVPSTDINLTVKHLNFFYGDSLRVSTYVNRGKAINLPTADTLGITDGTPAFFYYVNGVFTAVDTATVVTSDMKVMAYAQQPVGHTGHVFLENVGIISNAGQLRMAQAMYRVTSAEAHTAQLGEGVYSAVASAPGTVVVPASVIADSVTWTVTGIADRAFRGISGLRGINLPAGLTRIGSNAFESCIQLLSLTLPDSLTELGQSITTGANRLRYIDARKALGLQLNSVSRQAGPFGGTATSTYVYLPRGYASSDSTLQNFVLTDTAGTLTCSHLLLADKEMSPDTCRSGAVTYALNASYGSKVMGQRLGRDAYPLPLVPSDSASVVLRAQYVVDDTVVALTRYANQGDVLHMPTPQELGFNTSLAEFYLISASGAETLIPDSLLASTDLQITALPKSIAGEDGYIFTAKAKLTPTGGTAKAIDATYRVLSYSKHTAEVGDGRHNTIAISSEGRVTLPDSLVIGDSTFAVTSIARQAFKGNTQITSIDMPASVTAIGDSAFAHCALLERLTIPDSAASLGKGLVADCGELSYVDLRRATRLRDAVLTAKGGPLATRPSETLIYLPVGHEPVSATNVVCTDTAGRTTCKEIWADRLTFTGDDLTNGRASWTLNYWANRDDFGQRLGIDSVPVPLADSTIVPVRKVKVYHKNYLVSDGFYNAGSRVNLPTASQLGMPEGQHPLFTGFNGSGYQAFKALTRAEGDTAVWISVARKGDVNADGKVDVDDVNAVVNLIISAPGSEIYREYADVNGDGTFDNSDVTAVVSRILGQVTDTVATLNLASSSFAGRQELNVMTMGNSFSADAYMYVPYVLYNVAPNVRTRFFIYSYSGSTLQKRWELISNDDIFAFFFYYRGSWNYTSVWYAAQMNTTRVSAHMDDYPWNMLLLQQASGQAGDYSTMTPYIKKIVHWVKHRASRHIDVGFLLTPAYPEGSAYFPLDSTGKRINSNEMYRRQATAAQQLMVGEDVQFVIPAGTAIQNARTTALDTLGRFGHLSYDHMHLQDGAPCLTESYVVSETMLRFLNRSESINDEKSVLPIDDNWVKRKYIREWSLPVVGMEPTNVQLVKQAVQAALDNPFQITDLSSANKQISCQKK